MATTRHFTVFDSDAHVVEPSVVWEKYLDPEFRVFESRRCGGTKARRTRISRSTAK
jgi:hypothetical protein